VEVIKIFQFFASSIVITFLTTSFAQAQERDSQQTGIENPTVVCTYSDYKGVIIFSHISNRMWITDQYIPNDANRAGLEFQNVSIELMNRKRGFFFSGVMQTSWGHKVQRSKAEGSIIFLGKVITKGSVDYTVLKGDSTGPMRQVLNCDRI
jgi:hypothetical protein